MLLRSTLKATQEVFPLMVSMISYTLLGGLVRPDIHPRYNIRRGGAELYPDDKMCIAVQNTFSDRV